jgi:predicted nuclease of predicted toxin-antitoxin system
MKLLFDQNLSFRLCRLLNDLFPDSSHVQLLGLASASDRALWEYAKSNDFVVVSLDADFAEMSALLGGRPRSSGCVVGINRQPSLKPCCAITAIRLVYSG